MLTLVAPVEEKMDTLATRSVWGSELAGRMLSRGSKSTSPTGSKETLNSSGAVLALKGKKAGMLLQAQGMPRRCNSGLAQQNGTNRDKEVE